MTEKSKIIFDLNQIKSDISLEEIVALISTGDRNSPEYGLNLLILKELITGNKEMSQKKMYELYLLNREYLSKASFYRILNRLISRGMILFNDAEKKYVPSILFSNALQRLAIALETCVLKKQ